MSWPLCAGCRLVAVPQQQGGPEIQWEGDSRWIAISSALLGEVGRMQVLTPTILVHPASDSSSDPDQASDAIHTSGMTSPGPAEAIAMTPPPSEFLPPDIIAAAKQWMTMAADRLAIAGAAHMDAFVHADKGEIIIIDVHSVPDLSQDSLLLQQVSLGEAMGHPVMLDSHSPHAVCCCRCLMASTTVRKAPQRRAHCMSALMSELVCRAQILCQAHCVHSSCYNSIVHLTSLTHTALQALVEQPPVHPNDVLREVVDLAQLPISQDTFDEDPQTQYDSQLDHEEDEELLDPGSGLPADDAQPNTSYEQQTFQPAQEFDESTQAQNGGGTGTGWTDDSFTDTALDDDTFDASGFNVVERS